MDHLKMIRVQIAHHTATVAMTDPQVNAQNAELQDEMTQATCLTGRENRLVRR
jgi:hypothetical protein